MHEKDMPDGFRPVGTASAVMDLDDKTTSVSSLWNDVVSTLEKSVDSDLCSDNADRTLRSIRMLRQFVVASTTNKAVVSSSKLLRPRLSELLSRLHWWSVRRVDLCTELCGLLNSLVRDCSGFATHILSSPSLPAQLLSVILSPTSETQLREACLLLLRTLFGAEELSSVLVQTNPECQRHATALYLFTDTAIQGLMRLSHQPDTESVPRAAASLNRNALCYVLQLFALLATDPQLAACLHRLGAIQLAHAIIVESGGVQSKPNASSPLEFGTRRIATLSPASSHASPTSLLTARFALKLLVHVFFHIDSSLEVFKQVYQETDPRMLLSCYDQLISSISPGLSEARHKRIKRVSDSTWWWASGTTPSHGPNTCDIPTSLPGRLPAYRDSSVWSPSTHATQLFLGLLRGLIYWRMLTRVPVPNVDAVDQFGVRVASSTGLRLTDDDVALLVIQPLTEACLHVEDIRILSWICHVLVLVLNRRPGLHHWAVYTNSFIREVSSRVTLVINAVQEASDYHNQIQFLEHLIPLVKLFACLASTSETIRVLFTEAPMCQKLIEFTLSRKPIGTDHSNLSLEFQHSIAVLLHALSRSFNAHHSYFRHESTLNFLLNSVEEHLTPACSGHSLCASLVDAASSALINILLPMSPAREISHDIMQRCVTVFIRLLKASERTLLGTCTALCPSAHSSPTESTSELTADLRPCLTLASDQLHQTLAHFRLNGIWGLAHMLHSATAEFSSDLFGRLVAEGAWLELVRPVLFTIQSAVSRSGADQFAAVRRVSLESGLPGSIGSSGNNRTGQHKQRSDSLPLSTESVISSHKEAVPIHTLLVHYTLMLLRNLLRHRKVIDTVIGEQWWNIAQLIISVLEGDYPQPVKEQGILVLAHIANGHTALEQLHRNEDLTEKIKLFMRSSDSYTKAAALTATYNVLGLGRELSDTCSMFADATRQSFGPFFQPHNRRYRTSHHRHKERSKRRHEPHTDPSIKSAPADLFRREMISCVAQSALQEAEEIEDEEDQDIVVDHGSVEATTDSSMSVPPLTAPSSLVTCSVSVVTNPVESASSSGTDALRVPASGLRTRLRTYRSWQMSPESPSMVEASEQTDIPTSSACSDSVADPCSRVSSDSSTFSGTSSPSCTEELPDVTAELADLDRSAAQDVCDISPGASEDDLISQTQSTAGSVEETIALSTSPGSHAPLASEEAVDSLETHPVQPQTGSIPVEPNVEPTSDAAAAAEEEEEAVLHATDPVHFTRSRRNWEIGFQHVLLPFLQELDSNQILRGTWDWLMLRSSTRGRPIQLHHLLVAWQRLYDAIPTSNLSGTTITGTSTSTPSDFANLDPSLFTNCSTINSFMQRLRESSSQASTSRSASGIRHCEHDHRHTRRRHHHCHRHQLRSQTRRLSDRPAVVGTSTTTTMTTANPSEPEQLGEEPAVPDEPTSSH